MSQPTMTRLAMLSWAGGTLLVVIALLIFFLEVIEVNRTIPEGFFRGDQCETLHVGGSILEPQNTWSNFGYLLAGLLIFYRSRRLRSVAVGLFLCLTGVFSAMYHAVPTDGTLQMFDIAAVYWVLLAMIGYAALSLDFHFNATERDVVFEKLIAIVTLVLGTVMAVTRTKVWPFESTRATVSMVLILVALLVGGYFSGKRQRKDLTIDESVAYLGVVILVAIPTATFRFFDGQDKILENNVEKIVDKPLCAPDGLLGLFQAHAAWHFFSAVLLLIAFDYFARIANQADERIFADPDAD